MLYGYGSIIFDGALVTIEQALLSVALSFCLGLSELRQSHHKAK